MLQLARLCGIFALDDTKNPAKVVSSKAVLRSKSSTAAFFSKPYPPINQAEMR